MPLSQEDRKTFSLKIASADDEVKVYTNAKSQLAGEVVKMQKVDDANKNLFDPINTKTDSYQLELSSLDGNGRTTFSETNIQESAAVKIGNYFFPNNEQVSVPSLSSNYNIWTKPKPFARTFAIGKNYSETFSTVQKEGDLIATVNATITSILTYSAKERTTGLKLQSSGTCDINTYTTQATCEANSGVWTTGPDVLTPSTALIALLSDLKNAVNALKTFTQNEATLIVTGDSDTLAQAQNTVAFNNINNTLIPALNTWLGYVDFNSTGVNSFNYNTFIIAPLAPTKLYPDQINALIAAINSRTSFIATRVSQLNVVLGGITQDLSTGEVTFSGLYGRRYSFLLLRLDMLNGSLSKLYSAKLATNAQDSIISSIKTNKSTYHSVVPTSLLLAPGNNTAVIQLADTSFLSAGDTVYIIAEGQIELQRAIKSINGNAVILNDIVPAKYVTGNKLRLYKDLT